MRLTKRNYPYPVLTEDSDDYVDSRFNCILTDAPQQEQGKFKFNIQFRIDNNEEMKELIKSKKAFYGIHLECPRTHYREIREFYDDSSQLLLDKDFYRDFIEICSFIITAENLKEWKSSDFHSDYEGLTFNIPKGSRLAIGSSLVLKIDEEDEHEFTNSLFKFQKNIGLNPEPMKIDASEDIVIVSLSPENFNNCKEIKGLQGVLIESNLGLPIMMQLLLLMKEEDQDDTKRWSRVISYQLERLNIDLAEDDLLDASFRLLKDPLTRGLLTIKELINNDLGGEG